MDLLSGKTIGQYLVKEKLGSGGMAEVYKAFHPRLFVNRAIKVIRPEYSGSEEFRRRFETEARLVATLRHPNIVQIHDFGEENGLYYMVMEFVEGRNLEQLMSDAGLPLASAIDILLQVADGLQAAHQQGLLHRDLKPENIMLNNEGVAILMDFGIARMVSADTRLTQTGMAIGTPNYMSPEQLRDDRNLTAATDVYALGIVLFELLTGQRPYRADTPAALVLKALKDPIPMPSSLNREISEQLENVILKAVSKDADDRYPDAGAFALALRDVAERECAVVDPPTGDASATRVRQTPVVQDLPTSEGEAPSLPAGPDSAVVEPTGVRDSAQDTARESDGPAADASGDGDMAPPVGDEQISTAPDDKPSHLAASTSKTGRVFGTRIPVGLWIGVLLLALIALAVVQWDKTAKERWQEIEQDRAAREPQQGTTRMEAGSPGNTEAGRDAAVDTVVDKLAECAAHLEARRLTSGDGGNAYDCYNALLAQEPDNSEARTGLVRIESTYASWVRRDLTAGEFDRATLFLERLRAVNPRHTQLATLQTDLRSAREAAARASLPRLEWVRLRAGCFSMGSPSGEPGRNQDEQRHRVCIQRDFEISRYEITFEQFDRFADATGRSRPNDRGHGRGRRAVGHVSWTDAMEFARWLTQETGRRHRLPTEAEWEYACRGGKENGSSYRYCGGDDVSVVAWFSRNSKVDGSGRVRVVGGKKPNGVGLYDMSGNVGEWTCSLYQADYTGSESRCAKPAAPGKRTVRGNSILHAERQVRAASRNYFSPDTRSREIGFRLVREIQ